MPVCWTLRRQRIEVGATADGAAVHLSPHGGSVLLAGTSGIGKSTLATALTERFVEQGFQFCVLDPEGDYEELEDVVVVGDADSPPSTREIFDLLSKPSNNVVVNMVGLKTDERPDYFAKLLPELAEMRDRTGRPHWLVIDEAHHLMPAARDGAPFAKALSAAILITVHPDLVSPDVLKNVGTVMALGPEADKVIASFCAAIGEDVPAGVAPPPENQVLFWDRSSGAPATSISVEGPRQTRKRHKRKYAEGDLGDSSFYFRGPDGALKLKAQNLMMFLHIAEGHRRPHLEASPQGRRLLRLVSREGQGPRSSPTRLPASRPTAASTQARAVPASPKRCCAATRFRPTDLFNGLLAPIRLQSGEGQSSIWDYKMKALTLSVLRPANQEAPLEIVDPSLSLGVFASRRFTG